MGPTSADAWNAFEEGMTYYQSQQWPEAARSFEACLQKDSHWGAAYQYLALTYHAQGRLVEASAVAAKALEQDPGNTELATWVDRLRSAIDQKKAS
jgi:tetratricopeptide (TPR) repeat protein